MSSVYRQRKISTPSSRLRKPPSITRPRASGDQGELKRPEVCFIYVMRLADLPVAGFCAFWLVADQAHINNLAVRPELRGRGLGTQLLDSIVNEARHLGAASLTLEVRRSNIAARRLYAKSGFHEAGVRTNYYNQPVEDALVLLRRIS